MIKVTAAILEKDSRLLIAQRKKDDPLALKWELPGGKIEPNESPEECLQRELLEEFNIFTQVTDFFGSSEYEYPFGKIVLLAYRVKHLMGDISPTSHEAIKWVTPEEVSEYDFAEADKPLINKYLKENHAN